MEIERESRTRSIPKLITLLEETLGRSSGNTLENTLTTWIDYKESILESKSLTQTR